MNNRLTLDVQVPAQAKHYPIYIESGGLKALGERLHRHLSSDSKILLITETHVAELLLAPVQITLKAAGFELYTYTVPAGEESKTLAMAENIYAFALEIGLSRKDTMIALGGGVVGDLTGFCAATFFRGVPFIQLPTTLLAQVDSSVGGKVAVNFRNAKNGIGAFYQPLAVFIDPDVLASLPPRALKAGLAEVVKYAAIEGTCTGETAFFTFLETHAANLAVVFPQIIEHCCRLKAHVVAQDETETRGIRSYLNFGHTFAHAYEEITNYDTLLHGEAVAIGMQKAFLLAEHLGMVPPSERLRFEALCLQLELPLTPPPGLEPLQLLRLMRHDKKAFAGKIRLVLPTGSLGHVLLQDDVAEEQILSVLS